MDIRKFYADSVTEGLMAVREQLGSDAMILSVEEQKGKAAGKKRRVEILASVPSPEVPFAPEAALATAQPSRTPTLSESEEAAILASLYADQQVKNVAKPEKKARQRQFRTEYIETRDLPEMDDDSYVTPLSGPDPDPVPMAGYHFEPQAPGTIPPQAMSLFFYLTDIGMHRDIAQEMVNRIAIKMNLKRGLNKTKVRDFLSSMVTREVNVGGIIKPGRERRIAAMIGPTGVGKTTTTAKLATQLVGKKISVGLITVDQYRVGAVDQLKKFANEIKVPLLAAASREEFISALRAFRTRQVVLIDTAGQNPRDIDMLDRLDRTLRVPDKIERHLVLSAATKERDLDAYIELYRTISFDYLLFSKLDETATYGGMLNAYFAAERAFSYFTTGQRVPEDIEVASSERLNGLLFN